MISFAFIVLLLIAAAAGLYVTESALNIWESLQNRPAWLVAAFVGLIFIIAIVSVIFIFKLLFPSRGPKKQTKRIITEDELDSRLKTASDAGLNVQAVKQEIAELAQRRDAGNLYIAVFGEVNMGKSSIIAAILPDATLSTSNIAGTTRHITHYQWQSPADDKLILADVPGTEQVGSSQLSSLARKEALRAHIVIYVCDGDLSRTQNTELQLLFELKKPTIVAINKGDVYSEVELEKIHCKLTQQIPADLASEIVIISCRRHEEIVRIHANGHEEVISRSTPTDVAQLTRAIQRIIDSHSHTLDELRDSAVFVLAESLLDEVEAEKQKEEATKIVSQYTKRAIIGALATVTPGTDIIVQAVIGTSMVKAICAVYRIPVRNFDIETLLQLIQAQIGKSVPVILAIVGNGLKAFPGIGTLAGGLVHATAYAIVFDTLGKTLVKTLSTRGELRPAVTARVFQETLSENLESGPTDFIRAVLAARKTNNEK